MSSKADRTSFVGGSDVAGILGVSKWQSPLDVYLKKTNQAPITEADTKREKLFRRGHAWEPIVVDWMIEDYGLKVTKRSTKENPNYYLDKECDFMACEIDGEFEVTAEFIEACPFLDISPMLIGTTQNLEIKSAKSFLEGRTFGEEGTDEIPIEYTAQSTFGLGITGRQICLYGVVFGADDLTLYLVQRDDDLIAEINEKVIAFWHEHVLPRVAPDPINMADLRYMMRGLTGRPVELTDAAAQSVLNFVQARNMEKSSKEAKELYEFEFNKFVFDQWKLPTDAPGLGPINFIHNGRAIATWNEQGNAHFASNDFKEAYPELHAQFMRRGAHRVLRLKK